MTIVNLLERLRKYRTKWVEDLPKRICKNTIYIIGGREHPFYVAVTCPRRKCKKVIHLEISKQFEKRWSVKKEENGSISLCPSIHVIDSPCGCHYWVQKGYIVWYSLPPVFVPKINRTT